LKALKNTGSTGNLKYLSTEKNTVRSENFEALYLLKTSKFGSIEST
jgi:hypothetical protein